MLKFIRTAALCAGICFSGVSWADTVVIDFEGLSTGGASFHTPIVQNGFVIDPALAAPQGPVLVSVAEGNGTTAIIFCGYCRDGITGVSIYSQLALTFALDSLDIFTGSGIGPADFAGAGLVTGYFQGGGSISKAIDPAIGVETVLFDSAWSNLTSIDITFATSTTYESFVVPAVDNITLQVVPVPAAIWMFGSGLALLGWRRRMRH